LQRVPAGTIGKVVKAFGEGDVEVLTPRLALSPTHILVDAATFVAEN
jgi:hypothetical protein